MEGEFAKILVEMRLMRCFIISKMPRPTARMASITMRPFEVKKVNSKKSRMRGMPKTATMTPTMAKMRAVRSLLSGRESQ